MAPVTLPPLTGAAAASTPLLPLPSDDGKPPTPAHTLWADRPAVVLLVRRPGCQLCRAEATQLYKIKPELDALGVSLTAVLHESIPEQVAEFTGKFWPGACLLDERKDLFSFLGGGVLRKGTLLTFLNPFSRVWSNAKAAEGVEGNFTGDGLTLGGLLVVKRGGEVQYAYQEEVFGDHAPKEDVLRAAREAAGKA